MECSDEFGKLIAALVGALVGGASVGFVWRINMSKIKQKQNAGNNANQTQIGRDKNG